MRSCALRKSSEKGAGGRSGMKRCVLRSPMSLLFSEWRVIVNEVGEGLLYTEVLFQHGGILLEEFSLNATTRYVVT